MATETLRPNAAGDETSLNVQFPAEGEHWDKVDEADADDDTTYVYNSGVPVYLRDLYNLPASSGSGTINFIKIYVRCRYTVQGYAKPSFKSNGTVTDGDEITLTDEYVTYSQQWATNPAPPGTDAWTWDDIDALQIGVSLKASTYCKGICTQVYVEVDYTPAGVTHELAGVISGVCSVSGFTSITRTLAGLSAGVASTAGDLTVGAIKWLAGVVSGAANVSGFTSIIRALAGVSSGVCSTTSDLTIGYARWLAGVVSGKASVVADLTNIKWLLGVTEGACSTAGSLSVAICHWLVGVSSGACSVVGSLPITKKLAGVSSGVASTAASLTVSIIRWLAGISSGKASVSATLGIWKLLAGVIAGVATVTGSLFHVRRAIRVLGAVRNLLSEQNIPPVR